MGIQTRQWGTLQTLQSNRLYPWQFITYMFLHENILHLLMNMYAIYFFGKPLLLKITWKKFILLYFSGGIVGGILYMSWLSWKVHVLTHAITTTNTIQTHRYLENLSSLIHSQMLGASGAAFSLLAAFAVYFPNISLRFMFIPFDFKARSFIIVLIIYEIFAQITGISLLGQNIAHLAHIGGAITGGVLAAMLQKRYIK